LYGEHLTIAFADEPLAQYGVTCQPDQRHLATVTHERLFETPYWSPQPPLWELSDDWLTVLSGSHRMRHTGGYRRGRSATPAADRC
jgi:hypothetical protein